MTAWQLRMNSLKGYRFRCASFATLREPHSEVHDRERDDEHAKEGSENHSMTRAEVIDHVHITTEGECLYSGLLDEADMDWVDDHPPSLLKSSLGDETLPTFMFPSRLRWSRS
jgi:hypothetical protein